MLNLTPQSFGIAAVEALFLIIRQRRYEQLQASICPTIFMEL